LDEIVTQVREKFPEAIDNGFKFLPVDVYVFQFHHLTALEGEAEVAPPTAYQLRIAGELHFFHGLGALIKILDVPAGAIQLDGLPPVAGSRQEGVELLYAGFGGGGRNQGFYILGPGKRSTD
jgi:hypothetical protein